MRSVLWWVYFVAYYCGIIALFYRYNGDRQIRITYHNILPDKFLDGSLHVRLCHSESVFIRQMEIIARRWPDSNNSAFSNCLITFDDGYQNNHAIAGPILDRYSRRATFFITLDLVVNGRMLWPDWIMLWLSFVPTGRYNLLGRSVEIADSEDRSALWASLWDQLLANYRILEDMRRDMENAFPFERLPIDPQLKSLRAAGMTGSQLEDLSSRGHQIACHSYRHDILTSLTDAELQDDFSQCKKALGSVFNCALYSYPFGGMVEVGARERAACRSSGFDKAYLNIDPPDCAEHEDPYAIPRIALPNTLDCYVIEAKLSGFESAVKKFVNRLPGKPLLSLLKAAERRQRHAEH